jgi:Vps51/Vps67
MQRTSSASGARSNSMYSSPQGPSSPLNRRSSSDGVSSIPRRTPSSSHSSSTGGGLAQHMVQSMTIEEMRALHHRALSDADAKRQELRLVLASRYRELVGSSDEVVHMRDRALELQNVVQALPQLILKVSDLSLLTSIDNEESKSADEEVALTTGNSTLRRRQLLLDGLRALFRALDAKDVFTATLALRNLCTVIASSTRAHALANALSWNKYADPAVSLTDENDPALQLQMRMICAQIQYFPTEIRRLAHAILSRSNAAPPLAALVSLYLLEEQQPASPEQLIILYYQAKTQSLQSLLEQLSSADDDRVLQDAKDILSLIVLLLQQDIIVHPYQMFVQRSVVESSSVQAKHWPFFDAVRVQHHCSQYVF